MKTWKILLFCLICTFSVLCVVGCGSDKNENGTAENTGLVDSTEEEIVYPPVRFAGEPVYISFLAPTTLKGTFEEADIVAHVRVGNWLYETEYATYFSTEVIEQFKGKSIQSFTLYQEGSSYGTVDRFPLFTYGNELLVFLKEDIDGDYYFLVGVHTALFDCATLDSGETYFVDRMGIITRSLDVSLKETSPTVRSAVATKIIAQDSVLTNYLGVNYYEKDVLTALFRSYETNG